MLKLTATHLQEMRRHGAEAYPNECCGILIGTFDSGTRVVHATLRCRNTTLKSPQTHYHIDPHEVIRAQRESREHGLDIVGFYHSHPDHPAECSSTDLAEAHWIGCSYVIVAVENGQAAATKAFALVGNLEQDKHFIVDELLLVDSTC